MNGTAPRPSDVDHQRWLEDQTRPTVVEKVVERVVEKGNDKPQPPMRMEASWSVVICVCVTLVFIFKN